MINKQIELVEAGVAFDVNFGEAEGVQAGYKEGYKDGEAEGYSKGEAEGQAKGYQEGHTAGYTEGYGVGEAAGHTAGYTEGYDNGSAAGQAQGEREIWDRITANNTRKTYETAFRDWDSEYIRPPYKIYPKAKRSTGQMFCQNNSLKKVEAAYFDFSQKERGTANNQEGHYFTFYECKALEEVEDIGFQPDYSYGTTFGNCTNLKKIAVIRSDENTRYADTFAYAYAIEYVRFEGVIGQNGLNLRWSTKLSKASWQNVIGCLSATTTGLSITGSLSSVKKAFETAPGANDGNTSDEWLALIATKPNWTISLA